MLRVLAAEDDGLLRTGIMRLLDGVEGIEVVGGCGDLPQLEAAVKAVRPDVVVTDIRMPPTRTDEGLRAAAWLLSEWPDVGVVVLSQYVNPDYTVRLLASGTGRRAYLLMAGHFIGTRTWSKMSMAPPLRPGWRRRPPRPGARAAAATGVRLLVDPQRAAGQPMHRLEPAAIPTDGLHVERRAMLARATTVSRSSGPSAAASRCSHHGIRPALRRPRAGRCSPVIAGY